MAVMIGTNGQMAIAYNLLNKGPNYNDAVGHQGMTLRHP